MLNPYYTWAARWGIPPQALGELFAELGVVTLPDATKEPDVNKSEAWVQSMIKLNAAKGDTLTLWRNNVGALQDERGVPVRYGLMNESKRVNSQYKSGDLVGIRRVLITQQMVGHVIGQFCSIEVKEPGWQYTGQGRETAQMNWANAVNARGGIAIFLCNPDNISNYF